MPSLYAFHLDLYELKMILPQRTVTPEAEKEIVEQLREKIKEKNDTYQALNAGSIQQVGLGCIKFDFSFKDQSEVSNFLQLVDSGELKGILCQMIHSTAADKEVGEEQINMHLPKFHVLKQIVDGKEMLALMLQ